MCFTFFNSQFQLRFIVIVNLVTNCLSLFVAVVYTIEFQKRGLPHAHILYWVDRDGKATTVSDIDEVICAEIPDKDLEPELYKAVSEYMVHEHSYC